jgi:serine/threonine-protein kinase
MGVSAPQYAPEPRFFDILPPVGAELAEQSDAAASGLITGPTTVSPPPARRKRATAPADFAFTTATAAMRADEIARATMFFRIIVVVAAGVLCGLPFLGGAATARWVFAAGLVAYVAAEAWFIRRINIDASEYRDRNLFLVGTVGVIAAYAGVYYCGVFSPAPAIIVMALYMNSLVGSRRYTRFVYALCAAGQAGLSGLVMAGAIEDRGLMRPEDWSISGQIITQAYLQAVLLATFLVARFSRRETASNFARLEQAARAVAQRDALLNEARLELERSAWVGERGRFTEQTLGSFELGTILGRGAMGEIYEAYHVETGAPAAVKLLHRNVLAEPENLARFSREAEAIANIDSPYVVRVLEVSGEGAPTPYMAMERLAGYHLGNELQRRRALPVREVVELVQQVGQGVDAANAAGIVHRDLKPQNLFRAEHRGQPPVWKILDFGVSKLADHSGTLTQGRAIGTPTYMAPEQARGGSVDHRADVYALGAISYRALTGHPAFSGHDIPTILHDVVFRVALRPGALAELGADIDYVLAIALAKQRDERFESAAELADAMLAAARGELSPKLRERARGLIAKYPWGRLLT